MSDHNIESRINGAVYKKTVPARRTLADFLRQDCNLTGTHIGCEHGVCGACTVIVDGVAVRSCLMLAVQADGADVRTVEGVASQDGTLHRVQQVLHEEHGLQCGFCTPGFVMTLVSLVERGDNVSEEEMKAALSGHICRCTGYQGILRAVKKLATQNTTAKA
ncbi:MAG: (2Fe-2S)-binding protein [Betaproteobacteria bacterium]|nr:(2Fe-2S)-binding protein [Betaproteobacteria bacterium]